MKSLISRIALPLLALALLMAACGPTLKIRHRDPTHSRVNVYVGDEQVGRVRFGKQLRVRLERGAHVVRATPEDRDDNPWADDGDGWHIVLDKEAIITLLPPTDEWP